MDGDFVLNLEDVIESVETAEVMSLFFPTFNKAVVIDTRFTDKEGPMICIMPMVESPQERIRSIRRLRPSFQNAQSLSIIPWPRYVDSLTALGVWDRILRRFAESGHQEIVTKCTEILVELRRLEKAELAAVVLGENYHAIWSAGE